MTFGILFKSKSAQISALISPILKSQSLENSSFGVINRENVLRFGYGEIRLQMGPLKSVARNSMEKGM